MNYKVGDVLRIFEEDLDMLAEVVEHRPIPTEAGYLMYDPNSRFIIKCLHIYSDFNCGWSSGDIERYYLAYAPGVTGTLKVTKFYNFNEELEDIINE